MSSLLKHSDDKNKLFNLIIILFGLFLNQSGYIFGINASITDVFFVILVVCLILLKKLEFRSTFLFFFTIISITGLFSSVYYVPLIYPTILNGSEIYSSYLKFIIVFLYMVLGYNIASLKYDYLVIKSFWYGGVAIGILGVILTLADISLFNEIFYFASIRYKGLMIDPNYFAVIQVCVLACVVNLKESSRLLKNALYILIIISVLISGSKTGFITLILYAIFKLTEIIIKDRNKRSFIFMVLTIPILVNSLSLLTIMLDKLTNSIPILFRVSSLLNNPIKAVSSGGSGRSELWIESFNIIEKTPILGVGFGTFTNIMWINTGDSEVAHNTFIQIMAEWGILLSFISFLYILYILTKVIFFKKNTVESHVAKDIVFVLLVGSLGISLNNSRLLWFFIGILIYYSVYSYKSNINRKSVET